MKNIPEITLELELTKTQAEELLLILWDLLADEDARANPCPDDDYICPECQAELDKKNKSSPKSSINSILRDSKGRFATKDENYLAI